MRTKHNSHCGWLFASQRRHHLCSQLLKSEHWSGDHMTQGVQEQISILPAIEAKFHLREVCGQMLRADLVPASHDAALEQGKCGFNCVGMDITAHVDTVSVPNGFVLSALNAGL